MMTQTNYTTVNSAVSNNTLTQIQNNVKFALEQVMGDSSPDTLDEMASIFLEDAVPLIEQMKEGLIAHNYPAINMAAHALKGSSATIGLTTFASVCLAVESASKDKETDLISNNLKTLEAEYSKVQLALQEFLF